MQTKVRRNSKRIKLVPDRERVRLLSTEGEAGDEEQHGVGLLSLGDKHQWLAYASYAMLCYIINFSIKTKICRGSLMCMYKQ